MAKVYHATELELLSGLRKLFEDNPALLHLKGTSCGVFCCPATSEGYEYPWSAGEELESTLFLLDWDYEQALEWFLEEEKRNSLDNS